MVSSFFVNFELHVTLAFNDFQLWAVHLHDVRHQSHARLTFFDNLAAADNRLFSLSIGAGLHEVQGHHFVFVIIETLEGIPWLFLYCTSKVHFGLAFQDISA